jgi:hypothetical protein
VSGHNEAAIGNLAGKRVEALMATMELAADPSGFSAQVAKNQRRVFQIAYSVLGNAADAEEVAQEAFSQRLSEVLSTARWGTLSRLGQPYCLAPGA